MALHTSHRTPKYRRQKRKKRADLGFVELDGRRHYLGDYGSAASKEAYHRLLAEWTAGGRRITVPKTQITIAELMARFWQHVEGYYRKADGSPTKEVEQFRLALRPLRELYGETNASGFGPRAHKAVRQNMIDRGWCRTYINRHVGRLKRMFKWAVAEELIEPSIYQALAAIPDLKRGRTDARESEPVKPVAQSHVDAIRPYLCRQVEALVDLQLLTAARSGELVVMRAIGIDMSGPIWLYKPSDHKTRHHGHERIIYLGPRAQGIVQRFLVGRPIDGFLFSPAEAEAERRAALHKARKTPRPCGNRPGSNVKPNPKRRAGEYYSTTAYRRRIARACVKAGIPEWHPHQLRHSTGTSLRKEFDLEVARIILGHRSAAITEVYAELDHAKAIEVMRQIG